MGIGGLQAWEWWEPVEMVTEGMRILEFSTGMVENPHNEHSNNEHSKCVYLGTQYMHG